MSVELRVQRGWTHTCSRSGTVHDGCDQEPWFDRATVDDVVAWLTEQGAEIRETYWETYATLPKAPAIQFNVPGRYLVYGPLPEED